MDGCSSSNVDGDDKTSLDHTPSDTDATHIIPRTTLSNSSPSNNPQQPAPDMDAVNHGKACGIETPHHHKATVFRLQKCSTKIFGLSPVAELSVALQDTGLDTPKTTRTKPSFFSHRTTDKFQHSNENPAVAPCLKGAPNGAQLPSDGDPHQNLDNVGGGDTKDDESNQWQRQQEPEQGDEGAPNCSRFSINSATQSPSRVQAEQSYRSEQLRQRAFPMRIIYDETSKQHEPSSPSKENLLPTEELSFYQSNSPQPQSPRACSPSMSCTYDAFGIGDELLPSESTIIPVGSKNGGTTAAATATSIAELKMGRAGYRFRRPLDDHDPNSMDSGYGASGLNEALYNSLNSSATGERSGSYSSTKFQSLFQFPSSTSISRHSSTSSPSASRQLHHSLSSGSMESMDDMELFDMEAIDEQQEQQQQQQQQQHHSSSSTLYQASGKQQQVPSGLNSLICGTIKTTRTATTPEQKRPLVRRCLSLSENGYNQQAVSPLASSNGGQMKTPERFVRRTIAMEDQENFCLTPYSSRTGTEGAARCFKRPEPPGVSPVHSKRYKLAQLQDSMVLNSAAAAAMSPLSAVPFVNALDSPARTTVLAAIPKKPIYQKSISMNDAQIMSALSRSSSEPDLIGDFSKSYVLPLMEGQHRDLKSISGETMARLLKGAYDDKIESFKIIDCRYPYEFEGGHIRGAKNLYTQEQIIEELIMSKNAPPQVVGQQDAGTVRRHIIVFHCEFSSERGPKLSRFLRNHDRSLNADSYPALHYPEMYLLHGGYKEFFKAHSELCDPIAYRPMLDPEFGEAYRHFRAKSRSWNGDGTGTVKASAAPPSSLIGGSRRTKSRSRLIL